MRTLGQRWRWHLHDQHFEIRSRLAIRVTFGTRLGPIRVRVRNLGLAVDLSTPACAIESSARFFDVDNLATRLLRVRLKAGECCAEPSR